jgi:AICAR transformylase/IMP cyclohydrolase PurH
MDTAEKRKRHVTSPLSKLADYDRIISTYMITYDNPFVHKFLAIYTNSSKKISLYRYKTTENESRSVYSSTNFIRSAKFCRKSTAYVRNLEKNK